MGDNMNDLVREGYWSIATEKHLKGYTNNSPNLDEIDGLNIAGKAGRFLGAIRGNGVIENIKKLEKMAGNLGITKSVLHSIILPAIEIASDKKIEILRDDIGNIKGIAEYIFDVETVLGISGQVFENRNPSSIERITINTMDETKKIPYYQYDLTELLLKQGFSEYDINLALAVQEQFKLIERFNFTKNKNPIISNEYVWGVNHKKIATTILTLKIDQRETLKNIIGIVQNTQGIPLEKLPKIDKDILNLAQKTGMLDPTIISSSRGITKEFEFSPNLLDPISYKDDILDDVKLLLASIRFGENYTQYSTISDPEHFLRSLIGYGEVGPHSANETDYTLLEKRGIVKVLKKSKYNSYNGSNRYGYCLELIRKDVAEEALRIIQSPEYSLQIDNEDQYSGIILDSGSFTSPEEFRATLGVLPVSIREAEEHFCKVLRDELI